MVHLLFFPLARVHELGGTDQVMFAVGFWVGQVAYTNLLLAGPCRTILSRASLQRERHGSYTMCQILLVVYYAENTVWYLEPDSRCFVLCALLAGKPSTERRCHREEDCFTSCIPCTRYTNQGTHTLQSALGP